MTTRPMQLGLAAFLCTAAFVLVSRGDTPAPQAEEVLEGELKYLKEEAGKAKILKKAERKIRMAAVIAAAAAKSGKGKGELAEALLQAAKLMETDQAAAKKLIAEIVEGKGGTGVKAYKDAIDVETLMRSFSSEKVGGFGLEKALEDLVDHKGDLSADESKAAARLAAKIALIGAIAHDLPPEKELGKKTKAAWNEFSTSMNKAANELLEVAAKKGAVSMLADKLGKTCVACHDVFR